MGGLRDKHKRQKRVQADKHLLRGKSGSSSLVRFYCRHGYILFFSFFLNAGFKMLWGHVWTLAGNMSYRASYLQLLFSYSVFNAARIVIQQHSISSVKDNSLKLNYHIFFRFVTSKGPPWMGAKVCIMQWDFEVQTWNIWNYCQIIRWRPALPFFYLLTYLFIYCINNEGINFFGTYIKRLLLWALKTFWIEFTAWPKFILSCFFYLELFHCVGFAHLPWL